MNLRGHSVGEALILRDIFPQCQRKGPGGQKCRLGSLVIPRGWLLEAVFGDNVNLEGFGCISDILHGTRLVSVSEHEKQHSSRLD